MNNFDDTYPLGEKFLGASIEHDVKTGLSQFQLSTIDSNGGLVSMIGLLNELPEFTFSIDYTDGPGIAWQDMMSSFFTNDLMQCINMIGAQRGDETWLNFMNAGSWSKKVYNGYKPGSISLKFRIYSEDTLGQTAAKTWVDNLTNYATIAEKNKFSVTGAVHNVKQAIINSMATGKSAGNQMNVMYQQLASSENDDDESDNEKKKREDFEKKQYKANQIYSRIITVLNVYESYTDTDKRKYDFGFSTEGEVDSNGKVTIVVKTSTRLDRNNRSFTVESDLGIINPKNTNNDANQITCDENSAYALLDDIKSKISEQSSFAGKCIDKIKARFAEMMEKYNKDSKSYQNGEGIQQFNKLNMLLTNLSQVAGKVVDKYDRTRVVGSFNKNNSFGEKLWYLSIYNDVIFKRSSPLIVYISDWSVKYSEECLHGFDPAYADFSITCNLDQIYSRDQWYGILT